MRNSSIKQAIARNLKEARKSKHMTQVEVAEKSEVSTNHYAKIERGEVMPNILTLERILRAIKTKSSDILPF